MRRQMNWISQNRVLSLSLISMGRGIMQLEHRNGPSTGNTSCTQRPRCGGRARAQTAHARLAQAPSSAWVGLKCVAGWGHADAMNAVSTSVFLSLDSPDRERQCVAGELLRLHLGKHLLIGLLGLLLLCLSAADQEG